MIKALSLGLSDSPWFSNKSKLLVDGFGFFFDAYIAMIPKAEGDSTPFGQRPLCVLPVVSVVGLGSFGPSSGLVLFLGA